ncbi:MAG: LysM peptidoglycan-binding domain-containing protein, partial [Halanaerobiales bacterium]
MRKSHTALILLILLSLLSTPLIAGEDNLFEDREEGFEVLDFYHTVEPGDTLYMLAQRYETTIEKISEANGLESSIIQSGQRLSIPEEKSESEGTYVVQPGDSLYKIALRFNTTVSRLQELNELEENVIFTGQELKVPNISADSADISGKIT